MNPFLPDSPRKFSTWCLRALLLLGTSLSASAQSSPPGYLFTHLAGPLGGPGNIDGASANARFKSFAALAADSSGNIYVADDDNHTIRKVTPTGTVSTLAAPDGTALFFRSPSGIAVDATGNVYVSDLEQDTISKIAPGGVVSNFAGASYTYHFVGAEQVGEGTDGTGSAARFFHPAGLATDAAGNVYVADSGNHTIRKITPAGVVTTLAGTAGQSGSADGSGSAARFAGPQSVTVDAAGNVYVGDAQTTVRKITPSGDVTTLAGTYVQAGSSDGTGAAARFFRPRVAAEPGGNVFVTDHENHTVRRVTPAGVVTTFAGVAGQKGSADGAGSAARFNYPMGIAVDAMGNVYVGDTDNYTLRKITPVGDVTTLAAQPGGFGQVEGTGSAARFYFPQGVTLDGSGNVFVADFYNHVIRKVTPAGVVTTFAGMLGQSSSSAVNGTGSAARFYYPSGVAADAAGNLYVAEAGTNSIRKVTADGVVTTFAGPLGAYIFGHTDGAAADARFAYPEGIAVDAAGTVYVADSGNNTIRKITPAGTVSTLAGTAGIKGSADGTGAAAQFDSPIALTVDAAGNVFVADTHNHTIRRITPGGQVTTFAGGAGQVGSTDGVGTAARFSSPSGIAVDRLGNVFVGDSNNLTVRKIAPDGTVSTIGGRVGVIGSADGIGADANFNFPSAIAIDRTDTLYIADEFNHAIRKGQLAGPPVIISQPQSQSVVLGSNVQFSVVASGIAPLTYQWYFNGTAFAGATGPTLAFNSAQPTDAGGYTVVVTNASGSVTSSKATLTVTNAPVVVDPPPPSGGGGGGGAPSLWFLLALVGLAAARALAQRRRQPAIFLQSE